MKISFPSRLVVVQGMVLAALTGVLNAAAPDGRLFEPGRAWLERYDSTLVSSRANSEFSYESYDNDSDFYKIENTMRWGIPLKEHLAFGYQFMLPVKWTETSTDDEFGLGDLELRAGVMGRLLKFHFRSATFISTPINLSAWSFHAPDQQNQNPKTQHHHETHDH